jgi:hypothetical protein
MSDRKTYSRWAAFLCSVRHYPRRAWRIVWRDAPNRPTGIVLVLAAILCLPAWIWQFLKQRYLRPVWHELKWHYWERPRAVKADESIQTLASLIDLTIANEKPSDFDLSCDQFDACHFVLTAMLGREASDYETDSVLRTVEHMKKERGNS